MGRLGLKQRFVLLIFGLFLILFAAVTFVLVTENTRTLQSGLNQQSESFATLATGPIGDTFLLYKDSGQVRIQQQVMEYMSLDRDIAGISITDTNGSLLFSQGKSASSIARSASSAFNTQSFSNSDGYVTEIMSPYIESTGAHRYSVIYSISTDRIMQNVQQVVQNIVFVSVLVFVVAIVLMYQLVNRFFLRPISSISTAAKKISDGDFNQQIRLGRKDEIGDLADSLNAMANSLKSDIAKLEETDRLKSEFLTITSHNLRTPLTIINGYLDEMKDEKLPKKTETAINAIRANALRLDNFVGDILTISFIESGNKENYDVAPMEVQGFLETLAKDFEGLARQKQQRFRYDIRTGKEQVNASHARLKNAIWNILDNAHKFTAVKGSIELEAIIEGPQVVIRIEDNGIGIPKKELPKIFTKFHRAADQLSYNYEGTGIGLYISKLIFDEHKGSIALDSSEGRGTTVTIKLPLFKP